MADDIYEQAELADLELVRMRRRSLINQLCDIEDTPDPEQLDSYIRLLKDTETSATNKAKIRLSKDTSDAADEHNLILTQLLRTITPGGAAENNPVQPSDADLVLPDSCESDELVPGEISDSCDLEELTNDSSDTEQDP